MNLGQLRLVVILTLVSASVFSASVCAGPVTISDATVSELLTTVTAGSQTIAAGGSFGGVNLDGVAKLIINRTDGSFGCSGSLLAGGEYVITAAHCVGAGTGGAINVNSLTAQFASGTSATYAGAAYFTAPGWNGNGADGNDIAIIQLATNVTGILGYSLYTDATNFGGIPVDNNVVLAGYGLGGTGAAGDGGGVFGTLRAGTNEYDAVWSSVSAGHTLAGLPFAYDYANGNSQHDLLCHLNAFYCDGRNVSTDVMIAPGDSGGPTFIGGLLAGVHSLGITVGTPTDVTSGNPDASFGEGGADTRIAAFLNFIDTTTEPVPEPGTMLLLGSGMIALAARLKKPRA